MTWLMQIFKDLTRRTTSDKILRDKTFNIAKYPKCDGSKKALRTSFPPVTSTNVKVSHQNFLTFSFNPFATLV